MTKNRESDVNDCDYRNENLLANDKRRFTLKIKDVSCASYSRSQAHQHGFIYICFFIRILSFLILTIDETSIAAFVLYLLHIFLGQEKRRNKAWKTSSDQRDINANNGTFKRIVSFY